jgi:hypothetical protein
VGSEMCIRDRQKQAVGAALAAIFAAAVIWLETEHQPSPADGCQVCDCGGAVVALPGPVTPAADVSAVTAVAQ